MKAVKQMLSSQKDFKDMISIFNEEEVEFMVIGGMAVMIHGYVRATKDLDLWVWANSENSIRVIKALEKFGAPMDSISAADFEQEGVIFQIGVEPIRIDIITAPAGIKFEEVYPNIQIVEIDGLKIPLISIPDLIKNKKATGRSQDLTDVKHLERILKLKSQSSAPK